nr:VIT1/CCC1 transporter family protein [Tessaracoccus coleopterorum]
MAGWATRVTGFEVRRLAGHVNEGLLVGAGVIEGLTLANYPERAAVIAGLATLLAGAVSVASGSYAEMRSEQDALDSFLAEEERLRELSPQEELAELTEIYLAKGLPASLAREVAEHLPVREALAEHAVSKLGISPTYLDPRPVLAAVLMALAFVVGALAPSAPCSWRRTT